MKVETILTKNVQTIDAESSLHDAHALFIKHKFRHLPVTKNGKLVGMLSLTDIQRLSFGDRYGVDDSSTDATMYDMLNAGQVMHENVKTVSPNTTIKEVADIFCGVEFHALPVTENEKLVGIVTTTDLIKLLAKEL